MPPIPSLDLLSVFNAQPGATLLLSPDWLILGASDDYLAATLTERAFLVGQHIFDAFPDNPETPEANAVANVRASLEQVMTTRHFHEMAPQHYDVPDPTRPGRFIERHWQPRHTPVLDQVGEVQYIIQSVLDITESRRAGQQLSDSKASEQQAHAEVERQRQRFHEVLMQLPTYVAIYHGPEHVYQFVNPPYQHMFPHRSFPGRPLGDAMPEANELGVVALFDRVYQTGEPYIVHELEGWFDFTGTGAPEQVFLDLSLIPLRNAQGQVDGVLDYSRNVTEQVRARQQVERLNQKLDDRVQQRTRQLNEQQLLLARILGQVPAAIATLTGPEHRYTFCNTYYQELSGHRAVPGHSVLEVFPEMEEQGFIALLDRVYQTGEPVVGTAMPVQLYDANLGQPRQYYIDFVYQPLVDERQQVLGILAFILEVTDRVLARQQADTVAAEMRLLTAYSPAFLFRTDAMGSLEYLNKPFFEWTGLDATQLRSLDEAWEAVHPGDLAVQQSSFVAAVQAGQPWRSTPYRLRRHDGQYRWMMSRSQLLFGAEGQVLGHSGLAFEVHEQVELQQQLERTNVDLDTFVYAASHDLKAPIANIEGLLNALHEYLPSEAQQPEVSHLVHLMQGAITRFQETVGHLTSIARLQDTSFAPAEALDLAHVLADVRQDLLPLLESTQAELRVDLTDCPQAYFPAKDLRSILFNLLSNGVKYRDSQRPSVVQVRAQRTVHAGVVLTVQDNGLGLDARQQGQLFTMFRRLHTHVEGSGVGLYLIKRLIENRGGTIIVDSQPGVGSTFTVTLPKA
ncbi:PAS domain-containing sensor histidine kinase [Hymenobacter wooponensis]|uniref:histidine kinase n=1 Tax=Hymenobacter wooponensis TaxID=1525360 RepID=A0A4Z0MBD3_9BACT|nr:PAS domain-containing sensor histidine kinase [Hymenobacter wooponensis]TGD76804.1 PAS domain-containing sensor histidine kinase [Hymenobacter wooponensis]